MQGKSKTNLYDLYSRSFSINNVGGVNITNVEEEKIYKYNDLEFYFEGTSIRNSEKLVLNILIKKDLLKVDWKKVVNTIPIETFLLEKISMVVDKVSSEYVNEAKSIREKANFFTQKVNEIFTKRNGLYYEEKEDAFILKICFSVPLINAISVNAKSCYKAVKQLLEEISKCIEEIDGQKLDLYITTYNKEVFLRNYIKENEYIVFIANGSILPRENGTNKCMAESIPFSSPNDLEITIPFPDGSEMKGMGIKKSVVVITGGGYSGKSTLLDSIEYGIYNHIPGDGREYVISDESCLKIYAEDGRIVNSVNISPFFSYLPNNKDLKCFSTLHASGSVSQACNIIEAVNCGSKVLLIDEDKSATNFMIRDNNMRKLVKKEPIIPFTDRILELKEDSISTILVIGGSSEYLQYADIVLLMEDYVCKNITEEVKKEIKHERIKIEKADFLSNKYLIIEETTKIFLYFENVTTEKSKKIILDGFCSDITLLTFLLSDYQLNTLASMMEKIMSLTKQKELKEVIEEKYQEIYDKDKIKLEYFLSDNDFRYYEEVRKMDIYLCLCRMRGIIFNN